jgi:hypothetical protein
MKYETYYLEFINQIEIVEGKVSNKTIISWLETYIDKMTNKELMEIVEDGPPVSHLKDEQINDYKIEMKNSWTLAYFPISKEEQDQKFKEYATFIVQEYISYWLNKNGIITEEEESNDDSDEECFEHEYSDEDFDPVHFMKELGEMLKEIFPEIIKEEKEDEEDFITTMFQEVLNPKQI